MDHALADAFLRWSERDRRRSPHTLARYRAVLASLGTFADPATATREQVEAWWDSRADAAEATRANELACLRAFYRWATRFDHRADDPTRRLDAPKIPNHAPRPIGRADLDRLLGDITADTPDLRRAIALGAYGTCRVSEAAALNWANIDRESRRIYVRGKGRKERVIGLSPILLDYLLPETGGNVVTGGGPPISGPTLQRRLNRLMAHHGITHTFHDLRKRGATMALAKAGNPVAVTQVFGWASIETASAYAAVGDDVLDEIAEAMI